MRAWTYVGERLIWSSLRMRSGPDCQQGNMLSRTNSIAPPYRFRANVAEGHNRRQNGPYRNHVGIALGSQGELDTLIELSVRLRYASDADVLPTQAMTARVGQMLSGLFRSLK